MIRIVFYVLSLGIVAFLANVNFWARGGLLGLFLILRLAYIPLYLDYHHFGYDLFFDSLSFALWVLRVWLVILIILAR